MPTMRRGARPQVVARAPVPALRPVQVRAAVRARQRPDRAAHRPVERLPPAVLQRRRPHRAGPGPAPAAVPGDGPAGAVVAEPVVLRAGMGAGRGGTHRVAGLPAVGGPLRGRARDPGRQAVHPDAGKRREAMAAHDPADAGGARPGGPSGPRVARARPPGRRPEAGPARDAVAPRTDPVTDLAAGRPRPSGRMMRLHHRLPAPAVVGVTHGTGRDRAGIPRRAFQDRVGNVARRDGGTGGRIRHVAGGRKPGTHPRRQRGQRLRRRRQARAAGRVQPPGAPARPARQGMPRARARAQGTGEPARRARTGMAETDLHTGGLHQADHLYRCVLLKGRDACRNRSRGSRGSVDEPSGPARALRGLSPTSPTGPQRQQPFHSGFEEGVADAPDACRQAGPRGPALRQGLRGDSFGPGTEKETSLPNTA